MKNLKILMVLMIGLSLFLAASTAFAGGKPRHGDYSHKAYPHGKTVYVDRHVYRYSVAPGCAWGYPPAYPYRVYAPPVHRQSCAPYAPAYPYGYAYRPGWSFGFSFGW